MTLWILTWQAVCKKMGLAHHLCYEKSLRMGKERMWATGCKWQTREAVMTASLKYFTEDIAVLATLRWKWQGQQLARNRRLVWTEREITWTTHNLICSQSKNVVCILNSQCHYCSMFAVPGLSVPGWCSVSIEKSLYCNVQTIKPMKL